MFKLQHQPRLLKSIVYYICMNGKSAIKPNSGSVHNLMLVANRVKRQMGPQSA